jgi:ElaB/YqjD/DUF883 family membrane-anchored ribosome-binding protein
LREESQRNREALAATVGELREKVGDTATEIKTMVSPSHIKKEIKSYIREERESLVKAVQRRAQENPLQVAAVGAALAFPALSLLRAIPVPLMLIGAGLFLTSKRGQRSARRAKTRLDAAVNQGTEAVSELAGSIKSDLEDRIAGLRYGVEEARDAVTSGMSAVAGTARDVLRSGADRTAAAAAQATGAAHQTAEAISAGVAGTAERFEQRSMSAASRSRDAVIGFVQENPLLVAGIGAAVGAFIAASIPSSEAENEMFGAGSDTVKDKARGAAAQGIQKVGDVVAQAAGTAAATAAREGLDAAGVQRALNSVADSVRAVADRGLDTALGRGSEHNQNQDSERTRS